MFLKHSLFTIFIVTVFFGLFEVILAIAGVRPALSNEDPFVGFAENVPLFVTDLQADGSTLVRTADNKLNLFNYQAFPAQKDGNSYRVFCVGGSTTFGRPYDDRVSFCGWLRAYLKAADPARNWEIINAGGVSYASYRVTRVMDELVQYQPDLFIVYSGQNEFLEQRSYSELIDLPAWLISLNASLSSTRIYTVMSSLISSMKQDSIDRARERYKLSGEVDEILNHTIGPQSYHRDDVLKAQIMAHYRMNLERMVRIARQAGAETILVQPAINIRDMSPFKSEHSQGLDAATLSEWEALFGRARELDHAGRAQEALSLYRQALALDDRYADLHYRIGRLLFAMGDYAAAESELKRAVDEDIAPLRILAAMQQSVVEVAAAEDVPLVDFPAVLSTAYREQYGHAVFGSEYFVDHVHTSMEGYRLLGLALFDELVRQGIARPDAAWDAARLAAVREEVLAGLDVMDQGHTFMKLGKVLQWAGKSEEAYGLFLQALDILGPGPMVYTQLARSAYALGKYADAAGYLQEVLVLAPSMPGVHARLAAVMVKLGETDAAISHCRMELLLNPGNYVVIAQLAQLLESQGDDAGARQQYEKALQLRPDVWRARLRLVAILLRQNLPAEALAHAREALRIKPDEAQVHHALGLALKLQGDLEAARHHFSEALRLEPEYEEARNSLRQLQAVQNGKDTAARRS